MRKIIAVLMLLASAGCATASLTTKKMAEIDPQEKQFVLLSRGPWDNELRVAMAKHGFKIKKFATKGKVSQSTEVDNGNSKITEDVSYQTAAARYAIEMSWHRLDWCIAGNSEKGNVFLEISDVKENEVVAIIENGGWTGRCGWHGSVSVFEEISDEIAKLWGEK